MALQKMGGAVRAPALAAFRRAVLAQDVVAPVALVGAVFAHALAAYGALLGFVRA